MKKTIFSFSLLGMLGLFLASSGVWSSLHGEQENQNGGNAIVGSWDIVIPGTPFRILRTYDSGGGVVDAYAFPPFSFTPGPLINSPGHGTWVKTGPRQITVFVKYFQLDPSKNSTFQVLDSIGTVAEVVNLGGPDTYTSSFTTRVYKPDGSLLLTNAGTTAGSRIRVR
jgi:hypothetical protein